jgi:class 3 adenylate cyclase/tetratricopeptide (TPR) repeat protein
MSGSSDGHGSRQDTPHEARKLVTVLFSDLEGSTQLGEQLDTELLRALLTEYFEAMAAVVAEWGGTVEKYIGDAVLAVFGIPATREDDAVRAIRAGLEMQERLAEINPSLQERYGVQLTMRIGVNTGEVIASSGADALLAGDVLNVASRLEGVAEPGTVVVGERTHRATEDSFEFSSLGEVALKGKAKPLAVWRATTPRVGAERTVKTEMVGRSAELGMLDALMDQATGGAGPRLVVVVGEAGIGKSRLVQEFVSRQAGAVRTLLGRCLPYGQGITFWPLREVLWESAGIAMDDTSKAAASKLRALVAALPRESVVDPEWLAFALATTAGISLPDNPFDDLSPESAGEELQLAWPAFVSALASDEPTVLVIEDLHWAERPLLDMIELLALRALGPLLIVATTRPELMAQEAGWGARAIPSQISLGPLTQDSFNRLMAQLVPDLEDDQRHRLLDSAGGNPFFAEEIARHARDEGLESAIGGPISVPDNARAVLASRIDQLDAADREVLQDAAVIGEVFWPAPLEQIRSEAVGPALGTLERSGFITTRPTTTLPGQREMAFRHGLMCDVAYQSIARRRLATTHAAVAEWTEQLAADRRDEFIEVIAHHYAAAAQPGTAALAWRDDPQRREQVRAKAIEALVEAGKVARHRFAIDQAVEYADRALALASTDRERLQALELKAASFHAAARVDEAWPVYVEAIAAARAVGDDADVSRVITEATLVWARYGGAFTTEDWKPAAVEVVQTRLAEIGEQEESEELAALLTGRTVWGRRELVDRSAEEAKADAERAIAISEGLGSQRVLSHALDAYEMVLREEGFCALGELADRMVGLGSEMADRRQGHEMLVTAAIAFTEIGRYEDSRRVGAIAHADAQAMGIHQRIHGIRALTGYMVPTGMFDAALEGSEDLLDLASEDGAVLCDFGGGAVYGRALALFEQRRTEEGLAAVRLFEGGIPDNVKRLPIVRLQMIERARPFIGLDHAERMLRELPEPSTPARRLYSIRARLPIVVLREDWPAVEQLIVAARELAEPACSPQLLAFADWAESVRDGDVERAGAALDSLNEPYTAARLAVDFLGTIPASEGAELRAATAEALESMGAQASLDELGAQ